ncbi:hypothetical protein [Catenulispora subtropica]|uniref:Uncharacterized protein n=1 Tax=Catenulispora subtropica TaxID=450798 RepID=A0ABP5BW31_9ACTN
MRKILSFAALALSSGAAVVAAGGSAQASSSHNWCAAPASAVKVDAACITNHGSIHVGLHDTDLDDNWCVGAFSALVDHWSAPAMSCNDSHPAMGGHEPVGKPDCDDACKPHMPPPPHRPCPPPPPPVTHCPPGEDLQAMAKPETAAPMAKPEAAAPMAKPETVAPMAKPEAVAPMAKPEAVAPMAKPEAAAPVAGGLPILGDALGGLL